MPNHAASNTARLRHIPALDGVRGLAVLIVFVFHYGGGTHSSLRAMKLFGFVNKGGWSGVILFFVLSGFLITGILWDGYGDRHWWRKFFARRSLRIFPLYFLALASVLAAAIPGGTVGEVARHIWIPALFLENMPYLSYLSDNLASPLPIFHLWSIAVEEQYYLLWPAVLLWCWHRADRNRDLAKLLCAIVFFSSLLFRIGIWMFCSNPEIFGHFLLTQSGALAAGGWLSLAYRGTESEWARVVKAAPAVSFLGMAGFVVTGVLAGKFTSDGMAMMVVGMTFATVCFAGLICLAVKPGLVAKVFSTAWLRWLGNVSYGVYVFHVLLIPAIHGVTNRLAEGRGAMVTNAVQFVVAAALALVSATLSFHLYEKQFLRLKTYFVPRPVVGTSAPIA